MLDAYWFFANLLQPFTVLMLVLGVLVFWPQPALSPRRRALRSCYAVLYLYCTPLAASLPISWLESRYPRTLQRPVNVDAIVVLGGGALIATPAEESAYLVENSWKRCQLAARLYHDGPPCPVLASGGSVFAHDRPPPISHLMVLTLEDFRVPKSDLFVEDRSKNTDQNAKFSAAIIRQQDWQRVALVSNAMHLWRAERFFRNYGVDVVPVGCMFRSDEFSWDIFAFLPRSRALERHEEAMHELIGGLYAMLRGTW